MFIQETQKVIETFSERFASKYDLGWADDYVGISANLDSKGFVRVMFQKDGGKLVAWLDGNELHIVNEKGEDLLSYAECYGWTENDVHHIRYGYDINEPAHSGKKISIETSAGSICAEVMPCPDAPGMSLYFVPKGETVEIDLAYAETKESEELCHDNEKPDDVALYIFSDYTTDEWQERFDYPGEGIREMLSNNR